ncbi:MAG: NADH-quinone oxidoreductase subunit C [Chloroflexi bacterium]|nr:NADH-quinone oxidoreductase subunit C [Chloroflexota bacterium]MCH8892294.1 NADH-quinone oxidoreductase subunit C [Chloroflexota bacterium]MCI0788870.1 NADH-quinone oxidoreductase subunit C [Chloroflexota bacterium]MCI0800538.1 NADH-quinone oxidoreductase subunit C [Chloroflexota bacterium]MCI0809932.1 NADH-quinone oxidoreductase subunit C [Chloroflexota bacterium]
MAVRQLSGEDLAEKVGAGVPDSVVESVDGALFVKAPRMADVASFLKSDEGLDFNFLNSISAVDYINHFEVVYHLTSLNKQHTAIVKTRLDGRDDLTLPSVYHLWRGADFQEREIWDLMGVSFSGHPNMKRIMLWEGFEGHPLRKDYL